MRVLVDTCVISEVQRRRGNEKVRKRFESIEADDLYLSVLTIGELKKGIDKLTANTKKRSLNAWFDQLVLSAQDRILPIDPETALVWGEITAKSERQGRPIPAVDGLIAATAMRHGLHLMARNVADFARTGVMLINPWEHG